MKNHACQVCGKKFTTGSLLKRHASIHNDDKPFVCPVCGKNFNRLLDCKRHISVHRKKQVFDLDTVLSKDVEKAAEVNPLEFQVLRSQ